MRRISFLAALVLVLVFYDVPVSAAHCWTRPACNDTADCGGNGWVCLEGYCYKCKCMLEEQCYLISPMDVGCDCSAYPSATGDHCECPVQATTTPPPPCVEPWVPFENSCYLVSFTASGWGDSQSSCQAEDGWLAIVDTKAENDFLVDLLLDDSDGRLYWIGLSYETGGWTWVDLTPLGSYTQWALGYPGELEGCAAYSWDYGSSIFGKWVVETNCAETPAFFVCEKPQFT